MRFLNALHDDGSKELRKWIECFLVEDVRWSEARFRNQLQKHLGELEGIELKREAGISGTGTRVDLYAHYENHDYLITIKKGLSQQKVKNVIGEIQIMMDNWRAHVPGRKTYVILCFFGCKDELELEHLRDFLTAAARANHDPAFEVDVLKPAESADELASAAEELEHLYD